MSSAFLLARGGSLAFLGKRTWRLLLPLVFGMLVIVPVQPYVQGIGTGYVKPGYLEFLARYYQFRPWPEGAFDGDTSGVTWNHLWYLAYLWAYTVVLALALPLLRSRAGRWLQQRLTGLRGAAPLLLPALPIAVETVTLQGRFEDTGDLVHDGYRNALYFTVFLYGFWLARDAHVWDELARLRRRALAWAAALCSVYLTLAFSLPDDPRRAAAVPRVDAAQRLRVGGDRGGAGLVEGAARSPMALARLGERSRLPVVRPAPEPDRAAGLLADTPAPARRARSARGAGRHRRRLLARLRGDPARAAAAAAVRAQMAARRSPRGDAGAIARYRMIATDVARGVLPPSARHRPRHFAGRMRTGAANGVMPSAWSTSEG